MMQRVAAVAAAMVLWMVAAEAATAPGSKTHSPDASAGSQDAVPVFDVILRHGTLIDGTGSARYRADVGIVADRIVRIGDLAKQQGRIDIDVRGLFVAPGFINIHSHAADDALPTAENMLTQGVTTEIINPDGGGSIHIGEQLSRSAARGLAVNLGAYIGFGSVWREVMGFTDHRPASTDIERMRQLIRDNLEDGAWGVSAGLDYKPAYYATSAEVIDVVKAAALWRSNFPNHDRLTPPHYSSREGMAETIAIGKAAGLAPVITHIKSQGREQGKAGEVIEMMNQATAQGHYTASDVYPYLAGETGIGNLFIPGWAQEGGMMEMRKRFADPELRARIVRESEEAIEARLGGPDAIYLSKSKQKFTDLMREQNVSAGEMLIRVVEQGNPPAVLRFGAEEDLLQFLRNPTTAIACDCGASSKQASGHPRAFGTFPRVLGLYVRERKVLAWEEAVRKMSGLPAAIIGMVDRGYLAFGLAADITVFDPKTIIDHATYENPTALSEGVRYVLVNGRLALREGKPTGEQGGRVLLRTEHMPTRPMSAAGKQRVAARLVLKGEDGAERARLLLDVSQNQNARRASGIFLLEDSSAKASVAAERLGILQLAKGWASFTGVARIASGERVPLTVIIDEADPLAPGTATVVVQAGELRWSGSAKPAQIRISPKLAL